MSRIPLIQLPPPPATTRDGDEDTNPIRTALVTLLGAGQVCSFAFARDLAMTILRNNRIDGVELDRILEGEELVAQRLSEAFVRGSPTEASE